MVIIDLDNHPLIGMIHLPRLTWDNSNALDGIIDYAISEAQKLVNADFSAILIENFKDTPFEKTRVSDDVLIKLAIIVFEIKKNFNIPIGINILRNACTQAMTVASVIGLDFIRCNIWESAYLTDQGIIEGAANEVIQCKSKFKSEVKVLTDIHVKHARQLVKFDLSESALNAIERGHSDAIVISGIATGKSPDINNLKKLADSNIKPIIGSGLNLKNIDKFAPFIKGAIVGTSIKENNNANNPIDEEKAKKLVERWNSLFTKTI